MSTYRKIQLSIGTVVLCLSTSVSGFAATNAITPGKFQSDTVKLPVASIPSRQLNLTPDTNLIAGQIRDDLSRSPTISRLFSRFDDIWEVPRDRQKRLFDYCNSQKEFPSFDAKRCYRMLRIWVVDKDESSMDRNESDELIKIDNEIIRQLRG